MPFSETFKSVYDTIVAAMTKMGLEAIRADSIPTSAPITENVFNAIEQAGLVIGITSQSNPNVYYELGYAHRVGKETILLTDDPDNLPADLRSLNHLTYSPSDLPGLSAEITRWLESSRFLSSEHSRGSVLWRGEVFDTVVDGTFYLQKSRPTPSKGEIQHFLRQKTTMPQRLLYLTEEGQTTYLALCEDHAYTYYNETVQYVVDHGSDLVDHVLEYCGSMEVDFISLGPGNGHKDAVFLSELASRARNSRYTYYYPYDVSGGLLLEAMRTIIQKELPLDRLRVKAIEADIAYLAEFKRVFDFRPEPNVYSLLGGLDNMSNEVTLLTLLYEMMDPRDSLLLEVRKKAGVKALGPIHLNRRLDLAPLRYIGVKVDPMTVKYDEVTSTSSVPNARTIAATVPKLELDGKPHKNITLFSVHYYDAQEIKSVLTKMGFRILFEEGEQANSLFYIVCKAERSAD
jgi:hypothetical protein